MKLAIDSSNSTQLNVGIIGCGRQSINHLRVYSHSKGIRIAAVCDKEIGLAEEAAKKYGAKQAFSDPDAILKLNLDLVDIVTPTPTHASLAIQALESGHNVLVEKPMALSSKECDEMIRVSRRCGFALSVCHNKRFYASILQAKRMIEEEDLAVSRMRVTHFFIYDELRPRWILTEETGGVLWEAMVHLAYMLEHFLGKAESVYSFAKKSKKKNPVSDAFTLLTESEGRGGLAEYERYANSPLLRFQLLTENGDRIDGDLIDDTIMRFPRPKKRGIPFRLQRLSDDLYIPVTRWKNRLHRSVWQDSFGTVTPFKKTFYVLIGQYLSFIRGNRTSPPVMPEEGLSTIKVLEAAKRSIETGEHQQVLR